MDRARQRAEWERTAHLMSMVRLSAFSPEWVDPRKLNPYHVDPPKTAAQEQAEGEQAFKIMEAYLRQLAAG